MEIPSFAIRVAPPAGAWIETYVSLFVIVAVTSHPLRVRGLKQAQAQQKAIEAESHPLRVRGLKLMSGIKRGLNKSSHPLRVRGLKRTYLPAPYGIYTSHPLRVRGLKRAYAPELAMGMHVAPPAGAWIETKCSCDYEWTRWSHPLRVRGLKLSGVSS